MWYTEYAKNLRGGLQSGKYTYHNHQNRVLQNLVQASNYKGCAAKFLVVDLSFKRQGFDSYKRNLACFEREFYYFCAREL